MNDNDSELKILESVREAAARGRVTQRELASSSGLSLGITNAILKRFVERGWVKLTKLSSRSMRYALTPAGVAEMAHRAARFFQRASLTAGLHRERLERLVLDAKLAGATTLVLAGASEFDFLLDYLCDRHGLVLVKTADLERARSFAAKPGFSLLRSDELLSLSAPVEGPAAATARAESETP